jgi:hypothetical protein
MSLRMKTSKQMPHVRCRRRSARQAGGQPQWGLREAVCAQRARRSRWRMPHLAAGVACALVSRSRWREARSGAHGGLILKGHGAARSARHPPHARPMRASSRALARCDAVK